jgi:hypothetical protein
MRALDGAKTLWAGPDVAARPYHPFTPASALR